MVSRAGYRTEYLRMHRQHSTPTTPNQAFPAAFFLAVALDKHVGMFLQFEGLFPLPVAFDSRVRIDKSRERCIFWIIACRN